MQPRKLSVQEDKLELTLLVHSRCRCQATPATSFGQEVEVCIALRAPALLTGLIPDARLCRCPVVATLRNEDAQVLRCFR